MGRGVVNKSITIDNVDDGFIITKLDWTDDKCQGFRRQIKCDIVEAMALLEQFLKENV